VVLISSELQELLEGSDRIVVLKDGAVLGVLVGEQVTEKHLMNMLATTTSGPADATEQEQ